MRRKKGMGPTGIFDPIGAIVVEPEHAVVRVLYYGYRTTFGFVAFIPEFVICNPVDGDEAVLIINTRSGFGNFSRVKSLFFDSLNNTVFRYDAWYESVARRVFTGCTRSSEGVYEEGIWFIKEAVGKVGRC